MEFCQDSSTSSSSPSVPSPQQKATSMCVRPIVEPIAAAPRLLLVCSLGNPSPYTNTLHSAGHHLLSALRTHLSYPPFYASREHAKGLISRGQDALLWQSPTLMNASGPAVTSAWRTFLKDAQSMNVEGTKDRARLVVLHDELELELGKVKVRKPGGSMKGHNGLKSIAGMGTAAGGKEGWWRIGIGIGRPDSRDKGDVSNYVLKKMSPIEMGKIQGAAEEVMEQLVKLRDE